MKTILPICLLLILLGVNASAEKFALVGGTAINPADGRITENAVVVVDGDTIQEIGSGIAVPGDFRKIDCKGKFILPGYIDTHVHFFQSADLFTRPDAIDLTKVRSYADEV